MVKQLYPYQVPRPTPNQVVIFRNRKNGKRSYLRWYDNVVTIMQDEEDGETFNIYENNILAVRNETGDMMDILDTDGSAWGSHPNGIFLATVKFCCPSVAVGGGGGGRGRAGAQGSQGTQGPGAGAQGFQGAQGTTGSQGFQGFQGFQGSGVQGAQGFQGFQGSQGVQGAQGVQGFQGSEGAQGSSFGGFAEFVQYTQAPNGSVAPGLALELLTDNPTGVFNTLGITTAAAPTQGTAFNLPVGFYMVDYETSTSSVGPLVISQGLINVIPTDYTADINTKAGSTTATTWIHGRGIVESSVALGQWIIVGPTDSVTAAVVPTGGAPQYIVRVTFLKIG